MRFLLTLCGLFMALGISAQLNTRLLARLDYSQELNGIWGWTAPDGTEYALVGTTTGVSIVSLANPGAPREVAFVSGPRSTWRELKTFGSYAYVTTDQPRTKEGLLIIDLSLLPQQVRTFNWRPSFQPGDTLQRCHNLYIDEKGVAYLAGCNVNGGGIIFADVAATPTQPSFIGYGPRVYAHDVMTQGNRMFASEIYAGLLSIYDVSDKKQVKQLAAQPTPFSFTHNAWPTADGRFVFTTDERADAPVTAYDISSLDNIREIDQFRLAATLGQGVIPHNVHVRDNWLVMSHYTEGVRIVDASRPANLVETGYYDTYSDGLSGFHGAWGVYPYFSSNRVIVSDIENGLFVVEVDFRRAAFLEGRVSSASGGAPVRGAQIEIVSSQANISDSDARGDYRTGLAAAGTFEVIFRHPEYETKKVQATLRNGEVTVLNVSLTPKLRYSVSGRTVNILGNTPVGGAEVLIQNGEFTYRVKSDASGRFQLTDLVAGIYDITAGAWGYLHRRLEDVRIDNNASLTLTMQEGYQDDFIFDLGWTAKATSPSGHWQRGLPDGVRYNGAFITPAADIPGDFGEEAYLTGRAGGDPGADDVDDGLVTLESPVFDLSAYESATLSYHLWFYNGGSNSNPNDTLSVYLSNGTETILLEHVRQSGNAWRPRSVFPLAGRITLTKTMKLMVTTADRPGTGHIVEAAIDAFLVQTGTTDVGKPEVNPVGFTAYPNPFRDLLRVDYRLPADGARALLRLFNSLGQELQQLILQPGAGTVELKNELTPGTYFLRLEMPGYEPAVRKLVRTDSN